MSRPRLKRFQLRADIQYDLLTLFGTVPNAFKRLGLDKQSLIPASVFYTAVKGGYVQQFVRDMIHERWRVWQAAYGKDRTVTRDAEPWSIDDDFFNAHSTIGSSFAEEELDRIAKRRAELESRERAISAAIERTTIIHNTQRGEPITHGQDDTHDQNG